MCVFHCCCTFPSFHVISLISPIFCWYPLFMSRRKLLNNFASEAQIHALDFQQRENCTFCQFCWIFSPLLGQCLLVHFPKVFFRKMAQQPPSCSSSSTGLLSTFMLHKDAFVVRIRDPKQLSAAAAERVFLTMRESLIFEFPF